MCQGPGTEGAQHTRSQPTPPSRPDGPGGQVREGPPVARRHVFLIRLAVTGEPLVCRQDAEGCKFSGPPGLSPGETIAAEVHAANAAAGARGPGSGSPSATERALALDQQVLNLSMPQCLPLQRWGTAAGPLPPGAAITIF